jgi:hypothetical protein
VDEPFKSATSQNGAESGRSQEIHGFFPLISLNFNMTILDCATDAA